LGAGPVRGAQGFRLGPGSCHLWTKFEGVLKLEEPAFKLRAGFMDETESIDPEKIRSELAAGRTMTTIAEELGVVRSTVARHLQKGENGSTNGNGHAPQVESLAITEIERILESCWTRLPLADRLAILLERRTAN
jgi:hypothetical protein